MRDFYALVSQEDQQKRQRKQTKSRGIWIWLSLASIALAIVVAIAAWAAVCSRRHWTFRSDLSDSTVYAYQEDCLRADYQGRSVRVDQEDIYSIMNYINFAGGAPAFTDRRLLAPKADPELFLDYGDGTTLAFWRVERQGKEGIQLLYTDPHGGRYGYVSDRFDLGTILVRYITCKDAEPWV